MLLQFFIGKIDTELFETIKNKEKVNQLHITLNSKIYMWSLPVEFKTFKSINIQNSNQWFRIWVLPNWIVNLLHEPTGKV